jgi:hypothetical protein
MLANATRDQNCRNELRLNLRRLTLLRNFPKGLRIAHVLDPPIKHSNSVQTNHKTGRYKACHAGSPFRPSSSHKSHNICRKPKRLSFETFKCFKHWSFRKRNKRIFASSWPVDPYSNPFACTHGTVRQYVNVHVDNSATVHKPSRYIIYFASHTFTTTYCTCRDC